MTRIYCAITIDTEADHQPKSFWQRSDPLAFRSIGDGITKNLAPLFARYRARPTYLLTYEVMESRESVEILRAQKDCELGTHLHPECAPPRAQDCARAGSQTLACFLPREIERAKLAAITEKFRASFDFAARAYRAGAYGADAETLALLMALGYRADASVTPRLLWKDTLGSLDFRAAPTQPYMPARENIAVRGNLPILEIPITIALVRGKLRVHPKWLRPSTSTVAEMKRVIEQILNEEKDSKRVVLNLMFHSMESIAGASPYSRTEKEAREFLQRLERILEYCAKRGFLFATLAEIAREYS